MSLNHIDLTIVKDIVLIIGSLTATVFTVRSLNKWKKEHKGKLKYELARNLLKSIYDLRDDFKGVRSPLIRASEFSNEHNIRETKESEKYIYVFKNRMKYLQESYNSFLSLLPEVEIDYTNEVNILCNDLVGHIGNYHLKLEEYMQIVDNRDIDNSYHTELNSIIFNNGANNRTTVLFNETIEELKEELLKEIRKY